MSEKDKSFVGKLKKNGNQELFQTNFYLKDDLLAWIRSLLKQTNAGTDMLKSITLLQPISHPRG